MGTREDRLFERAVNILEGKAKGLGEPILWHLALRGHGYAMLMLASRMTYGGTPDELGRVQDSFSPAGMMYRLYRRSFPEAAQNMALSRFNIGDMVGYRRWIRLAALAGDTDTERDRRRFETRMPHNLARKLRRGRPYRKDGS